MDTASVVHIALASDHRYLPGLQATLVSIVLSASGPDRLQFHILADGLTDVDKDIVQSLACRVGLKCRLDFLEPNTRSILDKFKAYNGSHAPFLRLFLGEWLPRLDWIVYADVDTLWFRDVCELWNQRDDGIPIAWCRDLPYMAEGAKAFSTKWNPEFEVAKYACSGVALMNLTWMRRERFAERSFEFVEKWGTPFFVDQDILNAFCMKTGRIIEQYWDCMMPDVRALHGGAVLHFNGIGRMFSQGEYQGWRPLYVIWYQFYYSIVLQTPDRKIASWYKWCAWWVLGLINPTDSMIDHILRACFNRRWHDQIARQLFFAWLLRRASWLRFHQ